MKIIPKIENLQAMCKSPWRYFQNLFMGLGTGMVSTHTFSMGKIIGLLFGEKKPAVPFERAVERVVERAVERAVEN